MSGEPQGERLIVTCFGCNGMNTVHIYDPDTGDSYHEICNKCNGQGILEKVVKTSYNKVNEDIRRHHVKTLRPC